MFALNVNPPHISGALRRRRREICQISLLFSLSAHIAGESVVAAPGSQHLTGVVVGVWINIVCIANQLWKQTTGLCGDHRLP